MDVLIDASTLIGAERRHVDLSKYVDGRESDSFFLSVVTVSELLHGVHRAKTPDQRTRRSAYVEGIIARFPILDVDLETARSHAQLWAVLAEQGHVIGPHDLWLAASCLAHGLAIATTNHREFERVPGLIVETW